MDTLTEKLGPKDCPFCGSFAEVDTQRGYCSFPRIPALRQRLDDCQKNYEAHRTLLSTIRNARGAA